ncbi:MAG: tRNA1(Val) (adenine(37)-N6)-methyltransferase [Desulfotignum sp.]|nr:methyltransferase [Desulfobacteraceae bacterium]
MEKYTADTLFDPPLTIFQPKTGYRFSLDSLILAAQLQPNPGDRVIDAGCGCGIISLILGARHKDVHILGVELQEDLARLAQKNAAQNRLDHSIRILNRDIGSLTKEDISTPADIIVSNPPYKKKATGRVNPDAAKALARHEITLDITTLVRKASFLLQPQGQLCLIFPAPRLEELQFCLESSGFRPHWIRFVHFRPKGPAGRVLVSAVKCDDVSCTIRPPLYLYNPDGTPTADHFRLLQW